jgi:hypothetical protein
MTNTQLYLAIGLPCFSILIVWLGTTLSNRQAIKGLSKSIDDTSKSLSKSIDDLGTSLRSEMSTLATSLRLEMKSGFDAVNQRLDRLETIVDRIEGEIRIDHEKRITVLEERVLSKAS